MTQQLTFSYAPLNTAAALCATSAISGAMLTIFSFKVLLHHPDFFELLNYSYLGVLGAAAILPLITATIQQCKKQDANEKQSFDTSKGWFTMFITASTTAIANSIYYCATQAIDYKEAVGISTVCGMAISACALRMYMDRIKDNNSHSLA